MIYPTEYVKYQNETMQSTDFKKYRSKLLLFSMYFI